MNLWRSINSVSRLKAKGLCILVAGVMGRWNRKRNDIRFKWPDGTFWGLKRFCIPPNLM